jgi:hypothetical protein
MKKIQILVILSLVIMSIFPSCTTDDENVWFVRDATYCAEAWHNAAWATQDHEENAKTWLEMQGVTILISEYDPAGTTPEACLACSCLSGGIHRIQVDAEFTDIMVSEGFVLE